MKIAIINDGRLLVFDFNQHCFSQFKFFFSTSIIEASFKVAYFEFYLNKNQQEFLLIEVKILLSDEKLKEVINNFPQYQVIFMFVNNSVFPIKIKDLPCYFIREYNLYEDMIELFLKLMKQKDYYMINQHNFKKKICIEEIYYIESYGNYIIIHLIDQSYKVRDTIKRILEDPKFDMFHESTRGMLINLITIKELSSNRVILNNDKVIYLSKKKKKSFTEHYLSILNNI